MTRHLRTSARCPRPLAPIHRPPRRPPGRILCSLITGMGASLLLACSAPKQPSTEDLTWMCSGDRECMVACTMAATEPRYAESCQDLKQRALAARKAGIVLGSGGKVEVVGRSEAVLSPTEIAERAVRSIAVIETKDGLGTGFVVGVGRVATNLHVAAGADSFKVSFPDGKTPAVTKVAAYDTEHDLAILIVDATPPILTLADSDEVRLGEPVVAIGNPLGLTATVSNGLVSGLRGPDQTASILQISAPIAPGSSGGPVFNEHGEVIGVATAGARIGANLNFAMPAKFLKALLGKEKPAKLDEFAKATKEYMPGEDPPEAKAVASGKSECTAADRKLLRAGLKEALDSADPLCTAGKSTACSQLLQGAFAEVSGKLSAECTGPKKSLSKAAERALAEKDAKDRATILKSSARALLDSLEE